MEVAGSGIPEPGGMEGHPEHQWQVGLRDGHQVSDVDPGASSSCCRSKFLCLARGRNGLWRLEVDQEMTQRILAYRNYTGGEGRELMGMEAERTWSEAQQATAAMRQERGNVRLFNLRGQPHGP